MEKIFDENQPREQAGFRSGYSTIDHLHTMNLEKTSEYDMPLCLAFVDYEKAFDSVERTAIFNALYELGKKCNIYKAHKEYVYKWDFCRAFT